MISYTPLFNYFRENGISIDSVSERIGYNRLLRSRLNNGGYISMRVLDDICREYGLQVQDVIKYEEGVQPCVDAAKNFEIDWDKLTVMCAEKGVSFYGISRKAKLSVSYMSIQKRRRGRIPLKVVNVICSMLECEPDEFCNPF